MPHVRSVVCDVVVSEAGSNPKVKLTRPAAPQYDQWWTNESEEPTKTEKSCFFFFFEKSRLDNLKLKQTASGSGDWPQIRWEHELYLQDAPQEAFLGKRWDAKRSTSKKRPLLLNRTPQRSYALVAFQLPKDEVFSFQSP